MRTFPWTTLIVVVAILAAMHLCTSRVLRAITANREAIERKSHDDDASFDAGFEAGHLKGYAEGRKAGRPAVVVDIAHRRSAG